MPPSEQDAVTEQEQAPVETTVKEEVNKEEDPSDKLTPESPRFKEIYGKWKEQERINKSLSEDVALMKRHNSELSEAVYKVSEEVKPKDVIPNPIDDPEKFAEYFVRKDLDRDRLYNEQRSLDKIALQVEFQKELHDDYEDMIKSVQSDLDVDDALKNKIARASNPPKAAYDYAKRKAKLAESENTKERAGFVEGSGHSPGNTKNRFRDLTPEEKRVASRLGISQEDYVKQLIDMGRV
jgi:hypothetical protein